MTIEIKVIAAIIITSAIAYIFEKKVNPNEPETALWGIAIGVLVVASMPFIGIWSVALLLGCYLYVGIKAFKP